ncbi:MAG: hypothetical protein IPK70_05740 [Flavobacteriales bacterium]|jgi:hypothetical protein|nr:hypothetical protein [Flavobacteriales bacterium]
MPRTRTVITMLVVLALARYAAVCCFIHPFADDFSYAAIGMRTDLLPRLGDEYLNWNGRWCSNPFMLRGPLVLGTGAGLWLYRCVPLLLMLGAWAGARRLLRAVAPLLHSRDAALGSGFFLLLFLQLMPDLSEGVYWYTGAVSYLLPGALLLWLTALHAEAWSNDWRFSWPRAWCIGLLSAAIAGFNELHMMLVVAAHSVLFALHWRKYRRTHGPMLLITALTLASGLIMALAPGNSVRGELFPLRHDLGRTFSGAALQTARFALVWLLSPVLLLVSTLFLANLRTWMRASPVLSERLPRPLPIAIVLGVAFFACMALPFWASGLLGQHRTVNAALLVLLPGWLLLLASLRVEVLKRSARPWPLINEGAQRWVLGLLLVTCMATGSGGRVSADLLSGRLARFDAQLRSRYASIGEAKTRSTDILELPPLADPPRSLRYLDATGDPEHWINRSLANYLQADSVRIIVR